MRNTTCNAVLMGIRVGRMGVLSLSLCALAATTEVLASDQAPVRLLAPLNGFTSTGELDVKINVAKGFYDQVLSTEVAEATVTVVVEGLEAAFVYKISDSGLVTPIRLNPNSKSVAGYYWDISLDLTRGQCRNELEVVHHCDGCGRSFQTGDDPLDVGRCGSRAVKILIHATNKAGNSVCLSDLDGDGANDCALAIGSLAPAATTTTERYVPLNFWDFSSGAPVCEVRAKSGVKGASCKPIER